MRVADFMSRDVATIRPGRTAGDAYEAMRKRGVRHLVVTEKNRVLGVLSERDLGGARGGPLRRGRNVSDLMSSSVVTTGPQATVRQAANKMRGRAVGCLPVVSGERVVGIVTVSDLLDLLGRGVEKPVRVEGRRAVRSSPRGKSSGARR